MPARAKTQAKPAKTEEKPKPQPLRALIGNLTEDPELRFTPSGYPVATLRVAVNDRVKNEETGEWEDAEPQFFNCTVWRSQGENSCESLRKGDRIVAVGTWSKREYENREGDMVEVMEFTARELGPSLLFRTVDINQPVQRRKAATQKQRVEAVQDPWESDEYSDEPPF